MLAGDKHGNPSNYAVCAISEGAYPEGGQPFETGDPDPGTRGEVEARRDRLGKAIADFGWLRVSGFLAWLM